MRVISGKYKGRKLEGFNINGTRPTMDRVKESLFAMLQNSLKDAIILDLFAGSGSLGIEALSNGSQKCYFVDISKQSTAIIKRNTTNMEETIILNKNWEDALTYFKNNNITFNIIFLDPPYDFSIIETVIDKIINYNLLQENGIIICESTTQVITSLELIKAKKYGDKWINILKK